MCDNNYNTQGSMSCCFTNLCFHHHLQVDDVAAADAANFQLHPSVEFWANYNTSFSSRSLNAQAGDPNAPRYGPAVDVCL
jgi:hypothetical protein